MRKLRDLSPRRPLYQAKLHPAMFRDAYHASHRHACKSSARPSPLQVWPEPLLDVFDTCVFSCGVIAHLVVANFSDSEILRIRVGKIETAYAGTRMHGKR